jgi:Ca2+-transporting ATPase
MRRRPRSPDDPVIAPALGARLGFAGLLVAIGTLSVVAWAEGRDGLAVATTMGLVTMSLLHIAASLEWRDPYKSVFSRSTIANGRFNLLMLIALALTLLVTTIPLLQRIFDTVDLTGDQWRVCLIVVVAYFAVAEIGKLILRRFTHTAA